MPKEFLVIDQSNLRQTRSGWRAFQVDWRNIPITLKNSLAAVARTIREQIGSELSLTASAGVAPNKFLAKIASDWKKPDGLFVIQPEEIDSFLLLLPVDRLPGVGKVTEEKLKQLEVQTIAHLRRMDLPTLEGRFGRYGVRLYELARGIDNSEVVPDRPTQSISAEDTFEQDVLLTEMEPMIRKLAEHTWVASRKESRIARTAVLKLKTSEFKILTRSHTPDCPPSSCEELTNIALSLGNASTSARTSGFAWLVWRCRIFGSLTIVPSQLFSIKGVRKTK
jgi:DNA polymerase-4